MSVRIIGLDEVSTIQSGDFIAIDSETGGTKKFDATKVGYIMGRNIAQDYNPNSPYVEGEFCMYDGLLYECNTNITTPEAWNSAHWTQRTVGTALYDKVDKVSGKGLSTNDFTDALKTKLDDIEDEAQVNVIDGVKVDGVALTPDANKDVDIVGKANQSSIAEEYSTTMPYVYDDYVIYDNTLYRCTADTSGAWDANDWEVVNIGDELEYKANIDGAYDDMTVGNAEQLVSSIYEEDQVPYNFRTSGGSIDIGDRLYEEVVGGSLVWNQLASLNGNNYLLNNVSFSASGNAITIAVIGDEVSVKAAKLPTALNHVYLISGNPQLPGEEYAANIGLCNSSSAYKVRVASTIPDVNSVIGKASDDGDFLCLRVSNSTPNGTEATFKNVQFIDLTAMFGSTIADYIYSLEQANAGAGVAWFKKLFPKPYYAYNAGGIESVKAGSHVTTGFNQWDEEWEVGTYDANGNKTSSSSRIRNKNFIPVIPNTAYYSKVSNFGGAAMGVLYYDSNQKFISGENPNNSTHLFTTPSNCCFINWYVSSSYGTTYNHDICINFHWDGERDGEYEPYVKHTYPLDNTLELRGIPKLDSNNQLYFDGDTYESDGTVTRKYGIVDLGTLDWSYDTSAGVGRFLTSGISNIKSGTRRTYLICSKYVAMINGEAFDQSWDKVIYVGGNNVLVHDSAYTDVTTFKTAMSGVYLVYELATPTTEEADPYTNPQIVDDWGTEEYTDYAYEAGDRDVAIPVGHDSKYTANLKAKLEMAPDSPNQAGDYFMRQSNGENAYVDLSSANVITALNTRVPTCPTDTDGTFVLQATVSGGAVTYAWVSAT